MQLLRHLSNEELTETILEGDEQAIQPNLAALSEWLDAATGRPEAFWQRQGAAIHSRIAARQRKTRRMVRMFAVATALLILAIFLFHNRPAPVQPVAQSDPDQELLIAVERAVQTDGPEALEPAALLADEISGVQATTSRTRLHKGAKHEN